MPFIAFLGCDGSGKSAVIQGLKSRLEQDGHRVSLGHWRPKAFDPSSDSSESADDPHGQAPRGTAASTLKLVWLWLNWWIAWFCSLRAASRAGYVLFDRYHGDLFVDPQRYRYGGFMCLARLASRLMPQPDLVLFLDAEPEVLLSRKQEVAKGDLEIARQDYLAFCDGNPRCQVVDASRSLESVIFQAEGAIKRVSQ